MRTSSNGNIRRYWTFVRGIHRWPVNSPHKGQWSRALMFSLICAWINGWVNNRDAGDLRRHRAHYDVTTMNLPHSISKDKTETTITINLLMITCCPIHVVEINGLNSIALVTVFYHNHLVDPKWSWSYNCRFPWSVGEPTNLWILWLRRMCCKYFINFTINVIRPIVSSARESRLRLRKKVQRPSTEYPPERKQLILFCYSQIYQIYF